MEEPIFFSADAHEGPVWVADQRRLYFTTKTHLEGRRRVDILYLDFAGFDIPGAGSDWSGLPEDAAMRMEAKLFYHDINMANSMCLSADGRSLIVAEQGNEQKPSVVSRIDLGDKSRSVLHDNYGGLPFNSLNKVILTKRGHLLISDPDYGFRQDFRPAPELEPNLYTLTADGETKLFRCDLEMPHGLALTPTESQLFVTDTSNDGAHDDDIELGRNKSVWKFSFDPDSGEITGPGAYCFEVAEGVPDGSLTTDDRLLVGGGDGVYVADLAGQLIGKIPTPNDAVNLATAGDGAHLFVTIDDGVLLFKNWKKFVREVDA